MVREKSLCLVVCLFFSLFAVAAQEVHVNRDNRTVQVVVTVSIKTNPAWAVVKIGYNNYGRTREQTFDANTKAGKRITDAVLAAGVPSENLETLEFNLEEASDDSWSKDVAAQRQFEARHTWRIRLAVSDAQRIVDLAVARGAVIKEISWELADPGELDDRALSAAMAKSRTLGERLAKEMSVTLGDVLLISHSAKGEAGDPHLLNERFIRSFWNVRDPSDWKLFPKKIEREVSLRVVFAIR